MCVYVYNNIKCLIIHTAVLHCVISALLLLHQLPCIATMITRNITALELIFFSYTLVYHELHCGMSWREGVSLSAVVCVA